MAKVSLLLSMKAILSGKILYLLSIVMLSLSSLAADTEKQGHAKTHETGDHGHGSHAGLKHHAALLVAATSNLDQHHTDFTLGGDYQYRITPRWGTGAFGEVIFANHTEYLFGIPLYFNPTDSLWLRTGPGVEFLQESTGGHGHSTTDATEGSTRTKAEFLYRIGAGYNFHVGGWTIAPSLDLDLVRNAKALVWGLNIGKSF